MWCKCNCGKRRCRARTELHRVHVTMHTYFFCSSFLYCMFFFISFYVVFVIVAARAGIIMRVDSGCCSAVVVFVGCSSRKKASPALFFRVFLKGTPSASKWINKKSFVLLFVFIFSSDGCSHSTHSETHGIWSCAVRLNYFSTLLDSDFVSLIDARDKRTHTSYDLSAQQEQIKLGWDSLQPAWKQRPSTYAYKVINVKMQNSLSLWITYPYSSAAPAIPPPQWPIMYMAARSGEMAPITAMPNVTAGFICAPCCHRSYK